MLERFLRSINTHNWAGTRAEFNNQSCRHRFLLGLPPFSHKPFPVKLELASQAAYPVYKALLVRLRRLETQFALDELF